MSVSICIPTYNQADYVEATVRSAAEQRPRPLEIIVSNDCSTDGTAAILDRLAGEYDFLRVIHQPQNLGIGANVDGLLREGRGDYIVKLDSDDLLRPGYLAELSAALDAHPTAGYAHGQVQEIDEAGQPTRLRTLYRPAGFETAEESLRKSVSGYRVAANILMYRRTALERAGYVNRGMTFAEDYYLCVGIQDAGFGNVYVDRTLAEYRVWSDAGNLRQRRKQVEVEGLIRVFGERLRPAFERRGWPTEPIAQQRAKFAITHAAALGLPIFTEAEKDKLAATLLRLSDDSAVRRAITRYRRGMGWLYDIPNAVTHTAKSLVKRALGR